jgi:hypothetical protein
MDEFGPASLWRINRQGGQATPGARPRLFRHAACRRAGMNDPLPPAEIQVFHNVVSCSGRDPAAFAVELQDGQVHVTGPKGSAFYAPGNWLSRFSRHLERGFYDPLVENRPAPIRTRH